MLGFRKKQEAAAVSVQTRPGQALPLPLGAGERELYRALRENVPVIDAAVCKLRRLIGEFTVTCRTAGPKRSWSASWTGCRSMPREQESTSFWGYTWRS